MEDKGGGGAVRSKSDVYSLTQTHRTFAVKILFFGYFSFMSTLTLNRAPTVTVKILFFGYFSFMSTLTLNHAPTVTFAVKIHFLKTLSPDPPDMERKRQKKSQQLTNNLYNYALIFA